MKSVTIKDPITGKKLIKVFHNKEGYFVDARSDVLSFDCLIITDEKERITIPIRRAL